MYADGLSQASLDEIDAFVRTQWKALMATIVPRIEARLAADEASGAPRGRRVRIGLYMYGTPTSGVNDDGPPQPAPAAPAKRATAKTAAGTASKRTRGAPKRETR